MAQCGRRCRGKRGLECGQKEQDSAAAVTNNYLSAQKLMVDILLSLAGAATSIIFVATKHVFCRDKIRFVATKLFFHDKTFVRTNICFVATKNKHTFVATNTSLSRQACLCRSKHICRDKNDTCGSSRQ